MTRSTEEPAIKRSPKATIPQSSVKHYRLIANINVYLPAIAALLGLWQMFFDQVSYTYWVLLLVFVVLSNLGIEFSFHRNLSHRAFDCHPALMYSFAILGSMAAQGSLLHWVSNHRRHHIHSDTSLDPHSPHIRTSNGQAENLSGWKGFWHAQTTHVVNDDIPNYAAFAKDIIRNKPLMWLSGKYYLWVVLGLLLPGLIAWILEPGTHSFLNGVLWGGLIRIFIVHQITRSVASFAHLYGSTPYRTGDKSTNNWLVGLVSFGSGFQNTHHAFPNSAYIGRYWYEVDITGYLIYLLEKCGMVSGVKRVSPEERLAKSII